MYANIIILIVSIALALSASSAVQAQSGSRSNPKKPLASEGMKPITDPATEAKNDPKADVTPAAADIKLSKDITDPASVAPSKK